jgi:hypothetical protein
MRQLSDMPSLAPQRLLRAHSNRTSWLVSNGWALRLSCLAYSRPGRRTCVSPIRRPKSLLARLLLAFPSKVDEITEAVGVEGKGDDLIYRYSIAASLTDLGGRERLQRALEQQLRSAVCKTKDSQKLLRAGYTVQARYSFKGSPEEILISLPPWSCGN